MAKPKDPRLPKKNSRLNYLDQLMRYSWSTYRKTKDYDQKRESLTTLCTRIDEWLAEPGLIRDLASGPAPAVERKPWSTISPPDTEFPFDQPGESSDELFFFSHRGSSELFTSAQLELDAVKNCPSGNCGYVVTTFAKIYATGNLTESHFRADSAFERHGKSSSADHSPEPGRYFVLADPAGHAENHTMTASSSKGLAPAIKKADELAAKFKIRFLVARVVSRRDWH